MYLAGIEVLAKSWTGQLMVVLEEGPLHFGEIPIRALAIGDRTLLMRSGHHGEPSKHWTESRVALSSGPAPRNTRKGNQNDYKH